MNGREISRLIQSFVRPLPRQSQGGLLCLHYNSVLLCFLSGSGVVPRLSAVRVQRRELGVLDCRGGVQAEQAQQSVLHGAANLHRLRRSTGPQGGESFGQRAFSFTAPTQWNSLPYGLRHCQSSPAFKTFLKTHLPRICLIIFCTC